MAGLLKRRLKKSIILLAIASLAVIGFAACGKKTADDPQAAAASKDYIYRMRDVDLGEKDQNINQIVHAGDKIYAYGYSWSEDGSDSAIVFYELKEDGTIGGSHRIPLKEYMNINSISMDDDANIYCIKNDYHPADMPQEEPSYEEGEDTQEDGTADDMAVEDTGEIEYLDDYYLVKMTLSGEELFSVKLNDIPDFAQLGEENDYLYVRDMILDKEKGIYINSYGIFMKFDLEGNYLGVMPQNGNQSAFESANYITLEDGSLIAAVYEDNGMAFATVDLETGTMGEKNQLPGASFNYFFYAGKGYDLYLTDSYGVYGYNIGDSDKKQIMNFIDSDLEVYGLYQIAGVNDDSFFATYDNMDTGNNSLAMFTKVPPEEVKEKQVIVLAMADSNWNVRRNAINFNKENEDYRISILDYSSLYATDDDYMAGLNRLNTDIASGKIPDIILLNDAMPVESYIGKGLFEDLKPYIEKDEELDIHNLMPNIVEAYSVNGKMYSLVPSYSIRTILAKASDVGDERGWTVQEAMELLASKPEGTQLLESTTKSTMLMYCMSMSGNQFIDWESGTCNFNSDEFVQMLEFIGTFPDEIDDEIYTDDYWNNYESMWREGKVLASVYYLSSFRDYNNTEKGTFGEKITMIGFPSSNEDGSVISADMQFALSAKSSNKEGAWTFLRTFITDEYQKENVRYGFPISIKRLNELAAEAMEKPYYLDENGNKEEYDSTYYINGQEIIIPPMTKEETDSFMEQLYSFTKVYKQDDTLLNIITEESAPYFSGQKSAKDAASIIQSRVQIYVNENR